MKKYAILFNMIFCLSFNDMQAQELKNIVTSIEIGNVVSNTVVLKWKANVDKNEFVIYYHTSRISDIFVLREAELAIKSNFEGVKVDSSYEYEYAIKFDKSGSYYFAIVANNSNYFDTIAQSSVNKLIEGYENFLLPEINTTIQPISIIVSKKRSFQKSIQELDHKPAHIITSLNLESYEDIFHLKWSVYPKDLPLYIFNIYRSRYPISKYPSAEGLPVYVTVTNQFIFEDRNVSFEIPYYYAVSIQDSKQWTAGINIFNTPAVLLKKSPLLNMPSKIEYIKRKSTLPFYIQEIFPEKDIEMAVQKTLSNLQILSDTNDNQSLLDKLTNQNTFTNTRAGDQVSLGILPEISNLTSLESFLFNNNSLLTRADSEVKTSNPFEIKSNNFIPEHKKKTLYFTDEISKNEQKYLEQIENQRQFLLAQEQKDYSGIIKSIIMISNEIDSYNTITKSLLYSDNAYIKDFENNLNNYYDKRDNIRVKQYQASTQIKRFIERRKQRENDFLINIQNISIEATKKKISLYQDCKNNKKINNMVNNISIKMTKNKTKQNKTNLQVLDQNINQQIDQLTIAIKEEENKLLIITNNFKNTQISSKQKKHSDHFAQMIEAQAVLADVRSYYRDVTIEKVPTIEEIPKETWLYENKEIWISKQKLWQRITRNILGSNYEIIASKWMRPSSTLAIAEGRKAYDMNLYQEAIYLLSFATTHKASLMMLGQSYYQLGAYRDAFSVFITAVNMGLPNSRYWLDKTSEKILDRKIIENNQ
mgnify:CR=1 FL=1